MINQQKPQIIDTGAEANIIHNKKFIIKHRVSKGYRLSEIDKRIIKSRTKSETKLLTKAAEIINAPKPFSISTKDFTKIKMPFINGKKLSKHLDNLKNQKQICKQIGEQIKKLHAKDIIHGDLTTSNMILKGVDCQGTLVPYIYFIDFGLGFISKKIEDKAVDLHLLRQALEAKHYKNWEALFNSVLQGYKKQNPESEKVLKQLKKVESRGRYKH